MGHWNYRVILHDDIEEEWYGIHEVYYNDDDTIKAYSLEPDAVTAIKDCDGHEGIKWVLEKMLEAYEKPVLSITELEEYFEGKENG